MHSGTNQGILNFLEETAVVWKTALGSAFVWEVARLAGSKHPYLAPLTFILCLQATVGQSLRYALYRSAGTVIGVLLIGFFAKSIPVTAWALCIALLLSTFLMKLFRANDLFIHQVALSVLFVLYFENHSSGYAWDRAKDTLIGAFIGVLFIMVIVPPNTVQKTEQAIQQFVHRLINTVNRFADALQNNTVLPGSNRWEQLNTLLDEVERITTSLNKVKQGASFHIYVRKPDIVRLTERCHKVREACVHFVAFTQSLTDNMTDADRENWSHRMRNLAQDIPVFIYGFTGSFRGATTTPSAVSNHTSTFNPDVSEHEFHKILDALRGIAQPGKK